LWILASRRRIRRLLRQAGQDTRVGVRGEHDAGMPEQACTTRSSFPAASDNVAAPCRRSWNRIGGRPASPTRARKVRET
jgi:hypothetical protein